MRKGALWLITFAALLMLSQTASAAESGVLNTVVTRFKEESSHWASTISVYATWLFWTLATISLVWTFGFMAMRKADIGEFFAEFIRFSIFTGFYLWLLRNGPDYAMDIIRSMMIIGSQAGGVAELNPSTPVSIGFDILERSFQSLSRWKPIDSLAILLVCLIILVCLATVAANVLMVLVTAWVMAYAGMFVLGFGGSRWTSDIALGYFRTVAGIAMKLLTMTLLIGIATSVMNSHLADIQKGADINNLLVVCVVALVLAILIHSLPNIVAGLIPGGGGGAAATGSVSAGALAGAAIGAASTAASVVSSVASGGASLAANLAGGAQSMYSAFKSAQSNVSSGTDIASRMTGALGGGGGSMGGSGTSPLGAAMGVASAASGGMGGSASAMSAMTPSGSETSGGGSGGADGSAGSASDSGAGAMAQAAGGDLSSERGGAQSVADSTGSQSGGSSGGGSSSSKMGTAGRVAMDMGANIVAGMGRMAQSRIDQTIGGKLAAEISNPGASEQSAGLNTTSSSRNFDPASEVAAYRDSKQENS